MRSVITFLLLSVIHTVMAQNVTGIWRGHFNSSDRINQILNIDDRYRFEVQIAQTEKELQAVTYSYKSTDFYAKASAKGSINPKTGKVRILELKIIEVKKGMNTMVCSMDCFLTWTKSGDEEFLEGTYVAMNTLDSSFCGKGTIFLRKSDISDFYKEPFVAKKEKEIAKGKSILTTPKKIDSTIVKTKPPVKKTTPAVAKKPAPATKPATSTASTAPKKSAAPVAKTTPKKTTPKPTEPKALKSQEIESITKVDSPKKSISIAPGKSFSTIAPPVIQNRKNEVIRTITVKSDVVELNIYDNGTIDHDTVSVYVDNELVVSRKMLSLAPIVVKLKMSATSDYHEVVMVAENLGDIPPNTSLMVVKAGDQEYEVRITSTEQKNAVVVFRFAP